MKMLQRRSDKPAQERDGATFPFAHVVSYFDRKGYVYLREGPTLIRAGFPLPEAVTERLGVDKQAARFVLVVSAEDTICDIESFPLIGALRGRPGLSRPE